MSAFTPLPCESLFAWALAGLERDRTIFGLPQRSFWRGRAGFDLSVPVPGGRADTPLGPAAGPHTQMAQNIVAAWLAGARVIELKTVQVLDRLRIPRPCIDAPDEGYNVEWSQELRLEESLDQYVSAWILIHALAARGLAGERLAEDVREGRGLAGTHFDASAGYDLAGVRSEGVARFLDGLADATVTIRSLRDRLPAGLRAVADVVVPPRVASTVTVSTFHGCPPEEIEGIVEHLLERHHLNVVVKLNPTLLGHARVAHLLHDVLGRRDIVLDRNAFDSDLQWPHAVDLLGRLSSAARRRGLELGVKLTNTLVVRNTRGRLEGEQVYLSGAPLHPIALALADRLAASEVGHLPRSISAGVTAENFADTVACGFAPITTCTDLLKPTGYRRLPRYLKALEAELERTGTLSVAGYVAARAGEELGAPGTTHAARHNLSRYAERMAVAGEVPPFALPEPAASRPPLRFFDCESCNRCVLVCPNAAFFLVPMEPRRIVATEFVVADATLASRETVFETRSERQWMLDAGLCNSCGNCDTFCPEQGGPYLLKPRLHRNRESYAAASPIDGVLIEAGGERIAARFGGVEHYLERCAEGWKFGNDALEASLDLAGGVVGVRIVAEREGHGLEIAHFHALRAIAESVSAEVNPISVTMSEHWGTRFGGVSSGHRASTAWPADQRRHPLRSA